VWKRPGPKVRIYGEYGSKEFATAYQAALWGEKEPEKHTGAKDSFGAMIQAYRHSNAWSRLAEATRRQRGNMLDRLTKKAGHLPASEIDRAMIVATRDELKPGAGKCLIDTLRGLFKWAQESGYVDDDPTKGVKVQEAKTDGFHTWTDADIAAYELKWRVGSRERLWFAILIYTGLRRGDAISLGRQNIRDGVLEVTAGKTGTQIVIPLHPELKAILESSPLGRDTFIGLGWDAFGKAFRKACDEAGVKGSAHGLRKAAATKLAEAGASVMELNSIFGWSGSKMALRYTERSDRAKLAKEGFEKLRRLTVEKK
jgi:integrase